MESIILQKPDVLVLQAVLLIVITHPEVLLAVANASISNSLCEGGWILYDYTRDDLMIDKFIKYDNEEKEHLQFLKTLNPLEVGEYISNISLNSIEKKEVHLYDLITDHLIVTIFSQHCDVCSEGMESLYQFSIENPHVNIVGLFQFDEEKYLRIENMYEGRIHTFSCSIDQLHNELRSFAMPWAYCVNQAGQVLTSSPCNRVELFEQLVFPFKRHWI
ncbi:hypothetical protein [Marinicrinis sediminis]|uniref:Thioredoxin domain-containing protein n=1 Tax=Marinicrinis sediminis TaxID=1652465 RepID=A0ABW5R816_9BACL